MKDNLLKSQQWVVGKEEMPEGGRQEEKACDGGKRRHKCQSSTECSKDKEHFSKT